MKEEGLQGWVRVPTSSLHSDSLYLLIVQKKSSGRGTLSPWQQLSDNGPTPRAPAFIPPKPFLSWLPWEHPEVGWGPSTPPFT